MKKSLIVLSLIVFFFVGCKKDTELKKSVFVNDPVETGLPAYSEWGYNTFGANFERDIFISNNTLVPAKIVVTNDTLSFILHGQQGGSNYYSGYQKMTVTFQLKGFPFTQYTDLTKLNDTTINLKNPSCRIFIATDSSNYATTLVGGELFFKRAQDLQVDKNPIEVILSGYFDFRVIFKNNPVAFSEGRFDVGIGPDNFFNY